MVCASRDGVFRGALWRYFAEIGKGDIHVHQGHHTIWNRRLGAADRSSGVGNSRQGYLVDAWTLYRTWKRTEDVGHLFRSVTHFHENISTCCTGLCSLEFCPIRQHFPRREFCNVLWARGDNLESLWITFLPMKHLVVEAIAEYRPNIQRFKFVSPVMNDGCQSLAPLWASFAGRLTHLEICQECLYVVIGAKRATRELPQ